MQERQVTIEGDRLELPSPFLVLATQNPIDLEGTYPLPEAQIDRFLLHIAMSYPSSREEVEMLRSHGAGAPAVTAQLDAARVQELQALTTRVHVEDDLLDYVVAMTTFTRKHPRVILGAFAPRSHEVVDLAGCRVVAPPLDEVARTIADLATRLGVRPYDERSGEGDARYALLRATRDRSTQVTLVLARRGAHGIADLAKALRAAHPEVRGVIENLQPSKGNALVGVVEPDLLLDGTEDFLHQPYRAHLVPGLDEICGLRMKGLLGCALSGAGPSILVFYERGYEHVCQSVQHVFTAHGKDSEVILTDLATRGYELS